MKPFILLLWLSVAAASFCAQPPERRLVPVEARGLELTLTGPGLPVPIGSEATIKIHFENKSGVSYRLGDTQTELGYALSLYDAAGNAVPFTRYGRFLWRHGHSVFGPNEFPPGGKIDVEEDLTKMFSVSVPGTYIVKCANRFVEGFRAVESQPIRIVFR
jgi:hypothetical protein